MSYETLETERQGAILRVWLNRPERRNAVSPLLLRELGDLFRSLEVDFATRVVVLGGRGKSFCAGADRKPDPAAATRRPPRPTTLLQVDAPLGEDSDLMFRVQAKQKQFLFLELRF